MSLAKALDSIASVAAEFPQYCGHAKNFPYIVQLDKHIQTKLGLVLIAGDVTLMRADESNNRRVYFLWSFRVHSDIQISDRLAFTILRSNPAA